MLLRPRPRTDRESRTAARLGLRSQPSAAVRGDAPFAVMHGAGGYVYMVACSLVAATKEQTAMPNSDCWDRGCRLGAGSAWSLECVRAGHVYGPLHSGPRRAAVSLFLRMEVSPTACTMCRPTP